jgi:alpha-galactosidase
MIEARHKKTGDDLYPQVREKAEAFFLKEPGYSDMLDYYREHGVFEHEEQFEKTKMQRQSKYEWADRRIVKFMLDNYGLLPITVDSHFGEYIAWAADIVDHRGILDFFDAYKIMLTKNVDYKINLHTSERVVPIIDGILTNSGYEEAAVNVLNNGLISNLPDWIVVEVPAIINAQGVQGMEIGALPKGYASLLRSYCGVYDLTAEAIIHKKKDYVIQALLANPIVTKARNVKELVERMIDQQSQWLAYLK